MFINKKNINRTVILLSFLWLVFIILHIFLVGRVFFWNFPASAPTFLFTIISLLLLLYFLCQKKKRVINLVIVSICLIMSLTQLDINLISKTEDTKGLDNYAPIKVISWNTNLWDQDKDKDKFYSFIKKQDADVYLLQEYLHYQTDKDSGQPYRLCNIVPGFPLHYMHFDDSERIRKEFPGYYFSTNNQFVIISRFPIKKSYTDYSEQYAVTDVDINGRNVRFYNVHMLLHIETTNPLKPYFYDALHRRFLAREIGFKDLKRDLKNEKSDYFVAGDFNSTKAMGVMDNLLKNNIDGIKYSNDVLPFSYQLFGFKLWRIDFTLLPKANDNIRFKSYKTISPENLSDHDPIVLSLDVKKNNSKLLKESD